MHAEANPLCTPFVKRFETKGMQAGGSGAGVDLGFDEWKIEFW
jgi:hypothetical protein